MIGIPKLTWMNQVIRRLQWQRYLSDEISPDHDILITQNELAPVSIKVAEKKGVPSFFFVRSMALTGYEKYFPSFGHVKNISQTDIGGQIQYPFLHKNFHDYKHATKNATHTIANSKFTANKINELFDTDSTIIYPPIKPDQYRVKYDSTGYITMVNPRAEYKGADIFLDIASVFQSEEFLLVGPISSSTIKERAQQMGNVTHWGWCEDMRDAYSKTKLVIVPSRVEESFGRIPAEAMVSGIPCVVSDRGGLPEVVGRTGEVVDEVESIDHWEVAIRRALDYHDPDAQMERARTFFARNQCSKLIDLLNSV
ncbi:Glycosyl transferases group 1 [Natronorubrum thiooxidans]|uniref:Glycosyl transferases group 1 n=2 Tax=Natronorubrum thiooxidans TaxID=308853 RepID=A0A1N7CK03_9EURY|nr:Glycosyl transferases group 1 [Natronorubrum thiooxidans]